MPRQCHHTFEKINRVRQLKIVIAQFGGQFSLGLVCFNLFNFFIAEAVIQQRSAQIRFRTALACAVFIFGLFVLFSARLLNDNIRRDTQSLNRAGPAGVPAEV